MKKRIVWLLAGLSATVLLAACGGGGGGGGVFIPQATSQKVVLSGTVSTGSGPGAASVRKQQASGFLDGAKITIKSFSSAGVLQESVETVSGAIGGFSSQITALSAGGYLTVRVEKENTVAFEKTIPYTTVADIASGLQLQAILDPVLTKVIPATNAVGFDTAAIGTDMLSIAVVEDSRGGKKIVTNSDIRAAKASGGTINWQLDVAKQVFLNTSTTSLTVKAQNYNPANADDMVRFPADNADNGDRLVSAAFDFIDIKDQNGVALSIPKSTAKAVRKSAAVAYAVRKQIPDCKLVVKDEDTTKAGVQIGFYFMRNGKWTKLGNATLYKTSTIDDTNLVADVASACSGGLPYAALTDADVNSDIDFDLKWFNFDYVAFGDIKTACIEGEFGKTKTDPITGAVTNENLAGLSLSLDNLEQGSPLASVPGFRSTYGYTKSDGTYRLDFTYSNATLSSPTARLSYYDPDSSLRNTISPVLTTKNTNGCYVVAKQTVVAPACSVTGKLLKSDGTAAIGRGISVYQTGSYSGSRWDYTDASGVFTLPAVCGVDYTLYADGMSKGFNVNGTQGTDEKTDDQKTVTMKDITKVNNTPQPYIYADNSSVAVGNGVNLNGYGYDPDGDSLSYSWSATCGTFTDPGANSPSATSTSQTTKWTAPATAPGNNICTLTLAANDGVATGTTTTDIYVSATGNRPPVITMLYAPRFVTAGTTGNQLSVYAYDANSSDLLSYSWTSTCGSLTGAATASPTWDAPSTPGTCTVTATVSDGTNSVQKSSAITVNGNQPPVLTGVTVPATAGTGAAVNLLATAYDINNDNLTWSWSIVSGGGTLGNGCSGSGSGYVASTCSYIAPASDASVTLRFTVSDGVNTAVTRDKGMTVSSASGGLDVTIQ